MIIECENCNTQFETNAAIPPEGRKVRCARCLHVWTTLPDSEPPESEAPLDESEAEDSNEAEDIDESDDVNEAEDVSESDDVNEAEDVSESDDVNEPPEQEPSFAVKELAEIKEIDIFSDVETPTVPPLVPDVGSHDDISFSDDPVDDEAASEAAGDGVDEPEQEAQSEQDTDVFDSLVEDEPEKIDASDIGDADAAAFDTTSEIEGGEDNNQAEDGLDDEDTQSQNADASEEDDEILDAEQTEFGSEDGEIEGDAEKFPLDTAIKSRRRTVTLIAGWSGLAAFVIGFVAIAYLFRTDIVRVLPGSAGIYADLGVPVNIRGLEIRNVTFDWETNTGKPILRVQGVIQNITNRHVTIPTIVFAFQDSAGEELYHWAERVKARTLPAGKQVTFATRVPSPPKAVESLQVRFAKPR